VRGEVVGMNTAIYADARQSGNIGIGFAVPINTVRSLLPQLRGGKITRGMIGVQVQPVPRDMLDDFGLKERKGALVVTVTGDGPAEKAGVKMLVHAIEAVPNYVRFCIYSTGKTLAARKDEAVRFLAAEMAGFRHALANRDQTIELTREITLAKPDNPLPAFTYDEVKQYSAVDPDMPIPMDKLAWLRDLLVTTGNLTKPVDLDAFVDGDVRAKALQLSK